MKSILEIQNISKKFRIGHRSAGYLSLREQITSFFQDGNEIVEDFYALKDVSFTLEAGESLGIIGRNGAGKSTLLKILSRITSPSSGRIISRGRIASLLEVGTGFHPELTGRENIFFNGSLLGMKRKEIESNFEAIVDFSGVEKFMDTPLKHYSTGMQLRLAFSVAAFLEPEILIIDEVLAVGDAEFQKKCVGKMEDVSKSGRTILFVSHQMAAVEKLCHKTMLLENGRIEKIGETNEITRLYLGSNTSALVAANQVFPARSTPFISRVELLHRGNHTAIFYMGSEMEVRMHFRAFRKIEPLLGIIIYDALGTPVVHFNNRNYGDKLVVTPVEEGIVSLKLPSLNLMPAFYAMDVYFSSLFEDLDVKKNCFQFQIQYKHFAEDGEPLNLKYNKIFYKDAEWKYLTGYA